MREISLMLLVTRLLVTEIVPILGEKQFSLPEGSGPDGKKLTTLYQCEGDQIKLTCPAGKGIQVVRANFGRFSIAVCNQHGNTNWSTDCASPSAANTIKKMCNGLESCVVYVGASILGDACPGTPKYLEVHYFCDPYLPSPDTDGSANGQAVDRNSRYSRDPDAADLTSLWKHSSGLQDLNIDLVLKAVKEKDDVTIDVSRVPITSPPTNVEEESYKNSSIIRKTVNTPNVNNENINKTADLSNNEGITNSSDVTKSDDAKYGNDLKESEIGKAIEEDRWPNKAELEADDSTTTMFVLEVMTYIIAVICGVILNLLVIKMCRAGRLSTNCFGRHIGGTSCLKRKGSDLQFASPPPNSGRRGNIHQVNTTANGTAMQNCFLSANNGGLNNNKIINCSGDEEMPQSGGERYSVDASSGESVTSMSNISGGGGEMVRNNGDVCGGRSGVWAGYNNTPHYYGNSQNISQDIANNDGYFVQTPSTTHVPPAYCLPGGALQPASAVEGGRHLGSPVNNGYNLGDRFLMNVSPSTVYPDHNMMHTTQLSSTRQYTTSTPTEYTRDNAALSSHIPSNPSIILQAKLESRGEAFHASNGNIMRPEDGGDKRRLACSPTVEMRQKAALLSPSSRRSQGGNILPEHYSVPPSSIHPSRMTPDELSSMWSVPPASLPAAVMRSVNNTPQSVLSYNGGVYQSPPPARPPREPSARLARRPHSARGVLASPPSEERSFRKSSSIEDRLCDGYLNDDSEFRGYKNGGFKNTPMALDKEIWKVPDRAAKQYIEYTNDRHQNTNGSSV